jgi:ABC-type transport system involved in multi-copper enzyme maturation permease subunit
MWPLIYKDIFIFKEASLFALIWWIYLLVINKGQGFPFILITLVLAFQPLIMDDKNRTDTLFASLPVKRSTIVMSRYVSALGMIVIVILSSYGMGQLLHILKPLDFPKTVPFLGLIDIHIAILYFMTLAYPLFFKYGSHLEAGMKIIALIIIGLVVFSFLIVLIFNYFNFDPWQLPNIRLYFAGLGMVLLGGSFLLSLRIYRRREF